MIQLPEIGGSYPISRVPPLEISDCEIIACSQFVRSTHLLFSQGRRTQDHIISCLSQKEIAALFSTCKTSLLGPIQLQMERILEIEDENRNFESVSRLILSSWNNKTTMRQQQDYLSRILSFRSLYCIKILIPHVKAITVQQNNKRTKNKISTIFGKILWKAIKLQQSAIVQAISESEILSPFALGFYLRRLCEQRGNPDLVFHILQGGGDIPFSDLKASLNTSLTNNQFSISSEIANFFVQTLPNCYEMPTGPELLERVFTNASIALDLRKISFKFWKCVSDGNEALVVFLNRFFVPDQRDAVFHYERAIALNNDVMMTFCLHFFSEIDLLTVWTIYHASQHPMELACAPIIVCRFPTSSHLSGSHYQKLFAVHTVTELVLKNAWLYYRSRGYPALERIAAYEIINRYPDSPHFSATDYEKLFDCFVHSE